MPTRVSVLGLILVLALSGTARAMDSTQYVILQESLYVFLSVVCLILAAAIYAVLKGGSLGIPWLFILAGFAVAVLGATINMLETLEIVLQLYDMRLATLLTRVGSVTLFAIGLFLYRKGLG